MGTAAAVALQGLGSVLVVVMLLDIGLASQIYLHTLGVGLQLRRGHCQYT